MKLYFRAPLLFFLFFTPPHLYSRIVQSTLSPEEQQLIESSQPLNEIFSLMYGPNARYYKKLNQKEIKEGMEKACQALSHHDPHSSFLGSKECKDLSQRMDGHFYGIGGIFPGDKPEDDEFAPLIELVPNGPAEKAGLKAGDKIIQINDLIVKGMTLDEVMSHLKGEKNTKVTLKVMRTNHPEPLEFVVIRDIIKDEISASFYIENHNIYYLLLSVFSEKSIKHVQNLLEEAYKKECKGIIIDLRNNTGGLFEAALDIAGLFLPKGSLVVTTKNRDNKVIESWKTSRKPLARKEGVPIFFIVNNYTASSAEILSGSLQLYSEKLKSKDDLNVFIVGTETFGKGSVQEVIPLSGESALKMTTSLYYLPFDTCVQGKGIIPDFVIETYSPPSETARWMRDQFGRDSVLKKHIKPHGSTDDKNTKAKKTKKDEELPWKEKRKELLAQDFVLQNTVTLIDLLTIGKKANPKLISHKDQLSFLKDTFMVGQKLSLKELKD